MTTHRAADTAAILAEIVPHNMPGRTYPSALPAELARWYCYPSDCGHSIAVIAESDDAGQGARLSDLVALLVPVPVRTVQRLGWTMRDGFVVCPVSCDPVLGVLTDEDDDEY